jgi:hypothetical protein
MYLLDIISLSSTHYDFIVLTLTHPKKIILVVLQTTLHS